MLISFAQLQYRTEILIRNRLYSHKLSEPGKTDITHCGNVGYSLTGLAKIQ